MTDDEGRGGLWSKVKGFFDRDPDSPTDEDLSAAGWAGASQAAAQTASDWRASPVQVLSNALAGYNTARYRAQQGLREEAREERKFGLEERGLEARIAASKAEQAIAEGKLKAEQDKIAAAHAAGEGLPEGPMKENFKRAVALGEYDEAIKIANPEPGKPFGSDALGYFQFGPEGLKKVVQGLGRDPSSAPETFGQPLSPQEVSLLGLSPGTFVQRGSRGGYKINEPAASEPLEAVVTEDGSIKLVPRSQAPGMQPAPKQEGGAYPERLNKELTATSEAVKAAGGWANVADPMVRAKYERDFRIEGAVKFDRGGKQDQARHDRSG